MRESLVKKRTRKPRMVIRGSEVTVAAPDGLKLMEAFDRAVPKARQQALDEEMSALLNQSDEHVEVEGITLRKLE